MTFYTQQRPVPWIDEKYVHLLSHELDAFRIVGQNPLTANFRCPVCGDSKKNKSKARGYLYRNQDGSIYFKCHNCAASMSLNTFLKTVNEELYKEYRSELYHERDLSENKWKNNKKGEVLGRQKTEPPKQQTAAILDGLEKISDLKSEHPAKQYWNQRRIPNKHSFHVYWVPHFFEWVNKFIPNKFSRESLTRDHGRIIFIFRDQKGTITGFTGRSVNGEEPKYVAIKINDQVGVFGSERIDKKEKVIVVEGPIDSLFLENAVAMGSSFKQIDYDKKVLVFDNEPRNPEIVKIMKKAIKAGETIVIWPPEVKEKDINDMVLAGRDPMTIISENSFKGMKAELQIAIWRKS